MLLGVIAALAGCRKSLRAEEPAPPPALQVPIELTVAQRTTTLVPQSGDSALLLTIDDITSGQVMASLSAAGAILCPPMSLREGASTTFSLHDRPYSLTLTGLENALMGEDHATFVIDTGVGAALSETAKIEHLIQSVASLKNAVFIRNGREHTVEEAVDHMRMKWEAAGGQITTARGFIEGAASRSSMSGRAYEIRYADGTTVTAREYLYQRLERVESNPRE
jgi:hypothetical protein